MPLQLPLKGLGLKVSLPGFTIWLTSYFRMAATSQQPFLKYGQMLIIYWPVVAPNFHLISLTQLYISSLGLNKAKCILKFKKGTCKHFLLVLTRTYWKKKVVYYCWLEKAMTSNVRKANFYRIFHCTQWL